MPCPVVQNCGPTIHASARCTERTSNMLRCGFALHCSRDIGGRWTCEQVLRIYPVCHDEMK